MLPADDGYSDAATESHDYFRELWIGDVLTGDLIDTAPMAPSSSLAVSDGLVRRSGTIVIPNRGGLYTPAAGGLVDVGRYFLVRFGIRQPDGSALICDQPRLFPDFYDIDANARNVTVTVSDGMRIVSSDSKLSDPLSFEDGTAISTVVRALLVSAGAPDDDAYFDLDDGGAHLNGQAGYEVGQGQATILSQIATDYALDLWAAPPVVYTLRPIPDPATATPVATWQIGRQVRLVDIRERWTSLARNHAIVKGVDAFGDPVGAEVWDQDPTSPVRFGAPGVGDLLAEWTSAGITTPEQAETVARSLLVTRGYQRAFTASVPIDGSLDRRDVVRVNNPATGADSLAMLDSFPLPLAPGVQEINVIEARSLA